MKLFKIGGEQMEHLWDQKEIAIATEPADEKKECLEAGSSESNSLIATVHGECDEVSLVPGYHFSDGMIFCDIDSRIIDDIPIGSLNLSGRAFNYINRARMMGEIDIPRHREIMVSDLLSLNQQQVISLNHGPKSMEEIKAAIERYLTKGTSDATESVDSEALPGEEESSIAPGYRVMEGKILHIDSGKSIPDISIDVLPFSSRTLNVLKRNGIFMLSSLLSCTLQYVSSFSSMGKKSISEIIELVPQHLLAQIKDSSSVETENILPEHPPDSVATVLNGEYILSDGIIYSRLKNRSMPDAPIDILGLSVRARNCLMEAGIQMISDLLPLTEDDLMKLRNMGHKTANEIQEKAVNYTISNGRVIDNTALPPLQISIEDRLIETFHAHEFQTQTLDSLEGMLSNIEGKDLLEGLRILIDSGRVVETIDGYLLVYPSFYDVLEKIAKQDKGAIKENQAYILQMRAAGKTLEEIGNTLGVTRERTRQIETTSFRKVIHAYQEPFIEDKFKYLFSTYSLDKSFFIEELGTTRETWYYLNTRYIKGEKNICDAIEDEKLPKDIRRAIDRYIHRGTIEIDGLYIQTQRTAIEEYVIERYCKEEVTIDEFFDLYSQFIAKYGLDSDSLRCTDSIRRSRENRIAGSMKTLWKRNKRLRYYEIKGQDYSLLLETLNLASYSDTEISTRKFLLDYPELMEQYDLRDEYEIHNLLKKINAETENPEIVFEKMPTIRFGSFDRDAAVKCRLYSVAPISSAEFAEMLSLEFGVRADVISANWLPCVTEYLHQGIYSVEHEELPKEHAAKLKAALTDDFYYITDVQKLYCNLAKDADPSLISAYALKKMGLLVGNSYIIQHYPSADAYFESLFARDDVIDAQKIVKRFSRVVTFGSFLQKKRHNLEIIEFEPNQFININRLDKMGYGRDRLKEYCDHVWSYLQDKSFFTVKSLRLSGFEDEIDSLGFDDFFYSSILKEDPRYRWHRIGGAVVLNPQGTAFTTQDFIVSRIQCVKAINIDDFMTDLSEHYDIRLERYKVIEALSGSAVYYDPVMEKLYDNYATYFEEI